MKKLSQFSITDFLCLKPLRALIKELRNDLFLAFYKRLKAKGENEFIKQNFSKNKKILIIIAFEQDKVLNWLLALSSINLKDFQLMVFDNSRNPQARSKIRQTCFQFQIPYLGLPFNGTRHPNRSHGMAMTWVFHRIIKKIEPSWFGYLDHDMLPVKSVQISNCIPQGQNTYGFLNDAPDYWNLWAGYCFYNYSNVSHLPLNFIYDFSRELDTGGRNWPYLYAHQNKDDVKYATSINRSVFVPPDQTRTVQLIDDAWIHVGGVSYNNNLQPKEYFFEQLVNTLLSGIPFDSLHKD